MSKSWIPGRVVRSNLVHYIERSQIDPGFPRVCSVHNPTGPGAHVLTACGLHRAPVPDSHDQEVDCMPCVMEVAVGPEVEVKEDLPQEAEVPAQSDARERNNAKAQRTQRRKGRTKTNKFLG